MILLLFLLFPGLFSPNDPSNFTVVTVSGDHVKTSFPQLSHDGKLTLPSGSSLSPKEWYAIRKTAHPSPKNKQNPRVFLENGDILTVKSIESDGTKITVQLILSDPDHALSLPIPLSAVKRIQLKASRNKIRVDTSDRHKDALHLASGESVSGNILSIASERVRIQVGKEERLIDLSKIDEIRFNEDLLRSRKPSSRYSVLTFASGTRISLQSASTSQTHLLAQTLFKNRLQVPTADIVALEVHRGMATSLADLKPSRYEYRSYDGENHSWKANLSLTGNPLQLQDNGSLSNYDRGLGLYSGARLVYTLSGKYRRLEMLAGLDPEAGKLGNATLRIQVDGKWKELPEGGILKPNRILPIRVDLDAAKELAIEIDPGEGGFIQDYVNLAQTLLIAR